MKNQKNLMIAMLLMTGVAAMLSSCKKEDKMEPPTISFKTGAGYTSADATIAAATAVMIGIDAAKADSDAESEDILTHFNITKSVNGGTGVSIYDVDVPAANEDAYSYDLNTTTGATAGDTEKYTFTITNRDGLTGQVSLTLTLN